MKAPKEILDGWKLQREHGDVEAIHEASEDPKTKKRISRNTITNALNNGRMSEATFGVISKFYTKKREQERKLIEKTLK